MLRGPSVRGNIPHIARQFPRPAITVRQSGPERYACWHVIWLRSVAASPTLKLFDKRRNLLAKLITGAPGGGIVTSFTSFQGIRLVIIIQDSQKAINCISCYHESRLAIFFLPLQQGSTAPRILSPTVGPALRISDPILMLTVISHI
jgi:hypothetical protein